MPGESAYLFDKPGGCLDAAVAFGGAYSFAMAGYHRFLERDGGMSSSADAGGESDRPHIPVMLDEVLHALNPAFGDVMIDATFGAGGYSRALIEKSAKVIGIDRDPDAISAGSALVERLEGKLQLHHGRFSELDSIARLKGHEQVDGVVADIGVSSMQIDQAERGFSFQKDGPLDMRMGQIGPSAADVVNQFERPDLTRIIGILGEERQASRISAEIVKRREVKPFETSLELVSCVEKVLGRHPKDRIHPATRTFQALRIFVNQELEELADALLAAEHILRPGGRLAVVSFHSLEDRLVKKFFQNRCGTTGGSRYLPEVAQNAPTFEQKKRSALVAGEVETRSNPRARSAKLRFAVRTGAEARSDDKKLFGLPKLADLHRGRGTR